MANPDTLAELTDIAMNLARILEAQIASAAAADAARMDHGQPPQFTALIARLVVLYTKLARCIRQIVALKATLGTAGMLTPRQTATIDRRKQELRALAAEAVQTTQSAPAPDAADSDPKEAEHPAGAGPQDIRENLTDPVIDQPTAIATVARLIHAVRQALPTPIFESGLTAIALPTPDQDLTELATRIAVLEPEPRSPAAATQPNTAPAPIPDG